MKLILTILFLTALAAQGQIQYPDTTFIGGKQTLSISSCRCNDAVSSNWKIIQGSASMAALGNQATLVDVYDSTKIAYSSILAGKKIFDTLTLSVSIPIKHDTIVLMKIIHDTTQIITTVIKPVHDTTVVTKTVTVNVPIKCPVCPPALKQRTAFGLERDAFGNWYFDYDDGTKSQRTLKGGFVIQ